MLARQLNPQETSRFDADFSVLPLEHQADIAKTWRERCVNAINMYATSPVHEAAHYGSSVAYAGAIGAWDGTNEDARERAIGTWLATTAPGLGVDVSKNPTPFKDVLDSKGVVIHKAIPDPSKFFGVDKTVLPTLAAGIGVVTLAALDTGATVSPYLKAMVLTGVGYSAGNAARKFFKARAAKATAAKTDTKTEGGVAGNPRRYPRAVA